MNPLLYPIVLPILLGLICLAIPRNVKVIRELIALVGSAGTFGWVIWLFTQKPLDWTLQGSVLLRLDHLSGFVLLASGLFGFLITLYSIKFMQGKDGLSTYYGSLLWTLGAACGALLANHLILLLIFWGFLGITLYLLVLTGGGDAAPAAKKALVIVGGSDALILLGIGFIYSLTNTFEMDKFVLSFNGVNVHFAFILLALGVFAKIGAIPLHTWIPDVAENAPVSATAFLPGSLDKLLGIYLLARLCQNLFEMSGAMNLVLLIVGALTVIISVMMGLIQEDGKKLLGYLVITGAGYMVLGFGTGNSTGIAGGLFYMISSALWTHCLFLSMGSVEHRAGTTRLGELGGLVRSMPVTFTATLVAVLSISGIPPFNGFASKWMIYQGFIDLGRSGDKVWILWLVVAMFGSALTLAIGVKFIHSVFLGIPSKGMKPRKIREVSPWMTTPMVVLALLCVVFGIFAYSVPLKHLVLTVVPDVSYFGIWSPGLATIMILLGLVVGFIVYLLGNLKGIREAEAFIGGEHLPVEERITGTGFYNTVREIGGIQKIYAWAEAKRFDVYDLGSRLAFGFVELFRRAHTGVLTTYMFWILMGLLVLLVVLMGR